MRLVLALIVTLNLAPACDAGAWPRKQGDGFAATSLLLGWSRDPSDRAWQEPMSDYQTLYVEYGLTDRLTLGLDLGHSVSGGHKTIGFAQYPLRNRDSGIKIALQFGFGDIDGARVLRPGLSLGWGLRTGWLSVDTVAEIAPEDSATDFKLDATWGLNLNRGHKAILQIQAGDAHDDPPFLRLAPSYVFPVTARTKAEIGGSLGLTGDESVGLKLGLWHEF